VTDPSDLLGDDTDIEDPVLSQDLLPPLLGASLNYLDTNLSIRPPTMFETDLSQLGSFNTVKGAIGWSSNQATRVRILIDTGSQISFISNKIVDQLIDPAIKKATPISVRLTNGASTVSSRIAHVGITIDDYRSWSSLRILDWDAYDVILGIDWLQRRKARWDFAQSTLRIRNGSNKSHSLRLQPHSSIDTRSNSTSLNLITYANAKRRMNKGSEHAELVIIRQQPTARKSPELQTADPAFRPLIDEYSDIFKEELPPLFKRRRQITHDIDTGDAQPLNLPYYPLSKAHRDEQERQVRELLEKGLARPSSSPWGFPVLFVAKPGGKWRMCIDYRLLNNVTKKDGYPLPRVQDCLDSIGTATYLSKVDLTSGYWQIEVNELSIPKTAFNTRSGKYEFIAMPFGLTNAPATFQRIMNDTLRPFINKFVIVYMDDILIYSNSEQEHREYLR
jgi:hypothetical protein